MAAQGWKRRWRGTPATQDWVGTVVRAAVKGEALPTLLDSGARALLAAGHADRAGLWVAGDRRGELAHGLVVEAIPGPTPGQWNRLDLSAPFLRPALESSDPVNVECASTEANSRPGPLLGMHSATWIPLRRRDITFGMALVAHARPTAALNLDLLRVRADEIALAIGHCRDVRLSELAREERLAQLRLSRAILCGVSAESIFPQIARAARHHLQAEFVALGRGSNPPLPGEGWEGPPEWANALHQEPLLQLWRKAFHEGRQCEIPKEAIQARHVSASAASSYYAPSVSTAAPGPAPGAVHHAVDRVIAVPIEARNRVCGVLLAGLLSGEDSSDDVSRLESYALLADSALDREFARQERAASDRALSRSIEDSRECIVAIDDKGIIRDMSRAAAKLLFLPWRIPAGMFLEDCFSPVVRDAVTQWRQRVTSHRSVQPVGPEEQPISIDAALEAGGFARLHLRSELEGFIDGTSRWIIHFDDRGTEDPQLEPQNRLSVEMAGLVDSIESGVLIADTLGNVRMASDRLGAILGFESRRLLELGTIGAMIETVAFHFARPAETAARWREHVRRGDEASWDEFELAIPSRRIVERFARPLHNPDGTRLGWLEVYRDITGQRLIQSKLLQTEKMAALGQLVSGIAHELSNPLTSIQGYAQLLLSRPSTLDHYAGLISQEAERAARIVKNLLLFSRETKPERRAVNLNEVIDRTLPLRSYELKLENIAVELALDPALPSTLADSAQLQQVILNLIVNAEQAIVQGRGEENREGRILIRTRRLSGDRIGMEICDDGAGISPEIVPRIFDPFFTTKPAGEGTGLGLSIVYGIIQAHGGEVSVESRPGHGATLNIELPALSVAGLEIVNREDAGTAPRVPGVVSLSPSAPAEARPGRILVVEDEPTVAQLIADVMTEEGHQVDTLLDSREALRRLEEKSYTLIICDLKMPQMDGPGLYRALVRRGSPSQHRILFVTGDTMSPRSLEFLKSSGLPYLGKPFLVEELKMAVRMACEEIDAVREWPQVATRDK